MTPSHESAERSTEPDSGEETSDIAQPAAAEDVALLRIPIKLWAALLLMLVSFTAGFMIAAVARPAATPQPMVEQQPAQDFPQGPPLTEEQLSGSLPTNHPEPGAPAPGTSGTNPGSLGGSQVAPPLTEEQLQGAIPSDHASIPGASGDGSQQSQGGSGSTP